MPIDKAKVQWDAAPAIDPASVKWDEPKAKPSRTEMFKSELLNSIPVQAALGAVRDAGKIGATIRAPFDYAEQGIESLMGAPKRDISINAQRRKDIDAGAEFLGLDPSSLAGMGGGLAMQLAGTGGIGGLLGAGAKGLGAAPAVVSGLTSGGLNVAGKTGLGGLGIRALSGATTGAATAGLVDPCNAETGAIIGGAIPVAAKVGSDAFRQAGRSLMGAPATPEVAALADRAKQLGIQVPADRIANSKPLNAVAASLDYAPFSGRAATTERMVKQLNTAVSKTFGQNTDNVTMGLRKAGDQLGGEFDRVLKNNTVAVDKQLFDVLAEHANQASKELGSDGARIIQNQIDEIIAKGQNGQMDGQAAYNIKKTLDRIGKRNSPEAFYALDLKRSLMDALNRSLGADEAAKFAATRQQYGNMLSLEKIAKNGAEGDISIARLANMKNINSPDLQELADISAQFLTTRESPHGALQRLVIGSTGLGLGAGAGALPIAAGAMAAGRGVNSILNSDMARRAALGQASTAPISGGLLGATRAAPLLFTDR